MAKYKVTLTEEERSFLPNSKSIRTKRSYILLADENGDKHWTDKKAYVTKWNRANGKRFVEHGFEAYMERKENM